MAFRVQCKCGRKARICSSKEVGGELKQAYCQCTDPTCGHTFVINIEFSHTLSPSALDFPDDMRRRIRETAPAEQASLFGREVTG